MADGTGQRGAVAAIALIAVLAVGCRQPGPAAPNDAGSALVPAVEAMVERGDLADVQRRGRIRILVASAGEDFLPRQGTPQALDRELAREFARRHGLRVQFVLVERHDDLLRLLEEGRGEIAAAELTVTDTREKRVAFTRAIHTVSEWLVGKKGTVDLPRSVEMLRGRAVHVRASSSYAETLRALAGADGGGPVLVPVEEQQDTESIVYDVTEGSRPLTMVDSHLLAAVETYNPDVERLLELATGRRIAWAVRKDASELLAAANAFLMEKALTRHTEQLFAGDLDGIKERGVLRLLTRNNPITYFLYRGRQMGFDYELARMAANRLGVRLEVVVPPTRDQLIPWLLEGRGDMIGASLTVTPARRKQVAFSTPYLHVEELLVKRKGMPGPSSLEELKGHTIHVRPSSSYQHTLELLQKVAGPFTIMPASETLETEQLLEMVGRGEIPLTAADQHIVEAEMTFREDIESVFPLRLPGDENATRDIAFAVRPSAPGLKAFLDGFIRDVYRGVEYNMLRKRYFHNKRQITAAKAERAGTTGVLSPYDAIIKKYAALYGFDWRLMVAQAYQESRFDPQAKSWMGALGLFQVMPVTGSALGFTNLQDVEQGTHAGIKYMNRLVRQFPTTIPLKERIRFALAAYNVGKGHVDDARRLAESLGKNPDRWFHHVADAMLLLKEPRHYKRARYGYCRGDEAWRYVSQIQSRYDAYVKTVPR